MELSDQVQDELAVLRCQQGDAEGFECLVRRWQSPLLHYAARLLGDEEAALDAVQDTWMVIIRNLLSLRDVARFRPWVFGILHHKCQDHWRRAQRRQAFNTAAAAAPDLSPPRSPDGLRHDLQEAFTRLSPESRAVVLLHYREDFAVADIAEILNLPEGTVKSRLHHARQQLRELMEK